nr:MAG TPA: hypothetical protein [Caudoviricetes sp.]
MVLSLPQQNRNKNPRCWQHRGFCLCSLRNNSFSLSNDIIAYVKIDFNMRKYDTIR